MHSYPYPYPYNAPFPRDHEDRPTSDMGTTLSGWNAADREERMSHPEDAFLQTEDTSCIDFEALAERLTNSPPTLFPSKPGSRVSGLCAHRVLGGVVGYWVAHPLCLLALTPHRPTGPRSPASPIAWE